MFSTNLEASAILILGETTTPDFIIVSYNEAIVFVDLSSVPETILTIL